MTLIPQPLLARHWWPDGSRLDLSDDPDANAPRSRPLRARGRAASSAGFDRAIAQLFAAFEGPMIAGAAPKPCRGIRARYRCAGRDLAGAAARPTLGGSVGAAFTDPRLRQLFGRYATYVGGAPDLSPAVLALIWQAEAQGVWAVQGGMHQLAQALADAGDPRASRCAMACRPSAS